MDKECVSDCEGRYDCCDCGVVMLVRYVLTKKILINSTDVIDELSKYMGQYYK